MVALFLVVCLVVGFSFSASADVEKNINFIIGIKNKLTVTVSSDFACGGVQGVHTYDSSKLQYVSAKFSENTSSKNDDSFIAPSEGQIKFIALGDATDGTNGSFITFTFSKKNANALPSFGISSVKVSGVTGKSVTDFSAQLVLRGDCNDDSVIDIRDDVNMKKLNAGIGGGNIKNAGWFQRF